MVARRGGEKVEEAGVGEERWQGREGVRGGWVGSIWLDEGQSTSSLVHPEGETSFASCTITLKFSFSLKHQL